MLNCNNRCFAFVVKVVQNWQCIPTVLCHAQVAHIVITLLPLSFDTPSNSTEKKNRRRGGFAWQLCSQHRRAGTNLKQLKREEPRPASIGRLARALEPHCARPPRRSVLFSLNIHCFIGRRWSCSSLQASRPKACLMGLFPAHTKYCRTRRTGRAAAVVAPE